MSIFLSDIYFNIPFRITFFFKYSQFYFYCVRFPKALSPYISYNSLFMEARPSKDDFLKVTDTKDREDKAKKEVLKVTKEKSESESQDNNRSGDKALSVDSKEVQSIEFIFSVIF